MNPGEPQALVSLYHEPLPAPRGCRDHSLGGGVVSSDHLLDRSPFQTRLCLAVPSTTYQANKHSL